MQYLINIKCDFPVIIVVKRYWANRQTAPYRKGANFDHSLFTKLICTQHNNFMINEFLIYLFILRIQFWNKPSLPSSRDFVGFFVRRQFSNSYHSTKCGSFGTSPVRIEKRSDLSVM